MWKISGSQFNILKYLLFVSMNDDCYGLFPCSDNYVLGSEEKNTTILGTMSIPFRNLLLKTATLKDFLNYNVMKND